MNYFLFPGMPKRFGKILFLSTMGEFKRKEANGIIEMVCGYYGISDAVIKSKSRKRQISFPRQLCMWLLSTKTHMKLRDVSVMFGGRDHTCAIHARNTIDNLMDVHPEIRMEIEAVLEKYNQLNAGLITE